MLTTGYNSFSVTAHSVPDLSAISPAYVRPNTLHQSPCKNIRHPVTSYKYREVIKLDCAPMRSYIVVYRFRRLNNTLPIMRHLRDAPHIPLLAYVKNTLHTDHTYH